MNVRDIIKVYLKNNGYGGLATGGCGCGIDDLGPCEHVNLDECKAAHKRMCSEGCEGCPVDIEDGCDYYPPDENDCIYVADKKERKKND